MEIYHYFWDDKNDVQHQLNIDEEDKAKLYCAHINADQQENIFKINGKNHIIIFYKINKNIRGKIQIEGNNEIYDLYTNYKGYENKKECNLCHKIKILNEEKMIMVENELKKDIQQNEIEENKRIHMLDEMNNIELFKSKIAPRNIDGKPIIIIDEFKREELTYTQILFIFFSLYEEYVNSNIGSRSSNMIVVFNYYLKKIGNNKKFMSEIIIPVIDNIVYHYDSHEIIINPKNYNNFEYNSIKINKLLFQDLSFDGHCTKLLHFQKDEYYIFILINSGLGSEKNNCGVYHCVKIKIIDYKDSLFKIILGYSSLKSIYEYFKLDIFTVYDDFKLLFEFEKKNCKSQISGSCTYYSTLYLIYLLFFLFNVNIDPFIKEIKDITFYDALNTNFNIFDEHYFYHEQLINLMYFKYDKITNIRDENFGKLQQKIIYDNYKNSENSDDYSGRTKFTNINKLIEYFIEDKIENFLLDISEKKISHASLSDKNFFLEYFDKNEKININLFLYVCYYCFYLTREKEMSNYFFFKYYEKLNYDVKYDVYQFLCLINHVKDGIFNIEKIRSYVFLIFLRVLNKNITNLKIIKNSDVNLNELDIYFYDIDSYVEFSNLSNSLGDIIYMNKEDILEINGNVIFHHFYSIINTAIYNSVNSDNLYKIRYIKDDGKHEFTTFNSITDMVFKVKNKFYIIDGVIFFKGYIYSCQKKHTSLCAQLKDNINIEIFHDIKENNKIIEYNFYFKEKKYVDTKQVSFVNVFKLSSGISDREFNILLTNNNKVFHSKIINNNDLKKQYFSNYISDDNNFYTMHKNLFIDNLKNIKVSENEKYCSKILFLMYINYLFFNLDNDKTFYGEIYINNIKHIKQYVLLLTKEKNILFIKY
jgi:hypothetical protein